MIVKINQLLTTAIQYISTTTGNITNLAISIFIFLLVYYIYKHLTKYWTYFIATIFLSYFQIFAYINAFVVMFNKYIDNTDQCIMIATISFALIELISYYVTSKKFNYVNSIILIMISFIIGDMPLKILISILIITTIVIYNYGKIYKIITVKKYGYLDDDLPWER